MLHTKFQSHRSVAFGEETNLKVFTIYGHGDYVSHMSKCSFPRALLLKFFMFSLRQLYIQIFRPKSSNLSMKSYVQHFPYLTSPNKGQDKTNVVICIILIATRVSSFKATGQLAMENKIFKSFYHIWAWRSYWSCDLDGLGKFSFPPPLTAPYAIWLKLAK